MTFIERMIFLAIAAALFIAAVAVLFIDIYYMKKDK